VLFFGMFHTSAEFIREGRAEPPSILAHTVDGNGVRWRWLLPIGLPENP
jgi:hypothetical protein